MFVLERKGVIKEKDDKRGEAAPKLEQHTSHEEKEKSLPKLFPSPYQWDYIFFLSLRLKDNWINLNYIYRLNQSDNEWSL